MAQAPQQPGGEGAAQFVRQIVTDPKNVPDVMLLTGYPGASSEEAHERLYLSPDLTNYVEIPKAAILHQAPLPKEQDAHGGVTLWVKKDAALQYKMAPAAQALANYFAGAIQAGAAAAPAPVPPRPTVPIQCGPQTVVGALCPQTQVGPCPTGFGTCGVTCGATCVPQLCPPPTAGASCGCTNVVVCPTLDCPTFFPCTHFLCPTRAATCATCLGQASCTPCMTHQAPCPTFIQTCAPMATCAPPCVTFPHEISCAPRCTLGAGCRPTVNQPGCPFPTEICTFVAGCRTQQLGLCPLPQPFGAAAAPPAPPQSLGGCGQTTLADAGCSVGGACTFDGCGQTLADPGCTFDACGQPTLADPGCSFFDQCGSQFGSCDPICFPTAVCPTANCPTANCTFGCPQSVFGTCLPAATCAPNCTQICTFHVTCNPGCRPTNPAVCQIATGLCPVASAACPQPSLACGGFPGQPGFGGQVRQAQAVSAANCSMAFCTIPVVCRHTHATPCFK